MSSYALKLSPDSIFLSHHGILGQKWGKKNGPPYPLDFSKLSAKERAEAKKDTIDKGDVQTASAHRNYDYYSEKEINDLIARFNLNQRLKQTAASLKEDDIKRGMAKAEQIARVVGTVTNIAGKFGDLSQTYSKIKKAFDEAAKVDEDKASRNKEKYSYDEKKLNKMLKNPDKFSDEEWKNANERFKEITNMRKNMDLEEDRIASRADKKMEKARAKAKEHANDMKNIYEAQKKAMDEARAEAKKAAQNKTEHWTGKVEGEGTSDYKTENRFSTSGYRDASYKEFTNSYSNTGMQFANNLLVDKKNNLIVRR